MIQVRECLSSTEVNGEATQASKPTTETALTTLIYSLRETPTFTSTSTSTSSIHAQVRDINILIPQLCQYRASLRRNLNFRESAISRLPPETLGEIFQHICHPDLAGSWTPTKIGATCSYWRQIAWSTPQIWTSLVIGSPFWKSSQQLDILDLYYKNIGGLLLDMTILKSPDDSYRGPHGILAEEAFEKIFIENGNKLSTLVFKELPTPWLPHLEKATKLKGLPNLTSLVISDRWDQPFPNYSFLFHVTSPVAIHNVPRLEKLALECINTSLSFPWIQLTDLRLFDVDSKRALEAVLQCANLKFLKCENLARGSTDFAPPDKEVTLHHLERLEYSGGYLSPAWETALTTCLRFTGSFKQLTWLVKPGTSGIRKEFLLRLPTSTVDIRLAHDKNSDDVGDLEDILNRLTSLRFLMLRFDGPLDIKVIDWLTVRDNHHSLLSLRALGLSIPNEKLADSEFLHILNMTRSRWEASDEEDTFQGCTFGFPCFEKNTVQWPIKFMDGMKKLVYEGLQIWLVGKEGKRLDEWLDEARYIYCGI